MASKESFLLLLPAFVLFYIWQLEMINPSWSWKQLVTKALPFAIPVAILFFAELIYLLVYFGGQARGVGVSIDTPLNTYVRTLLDFFATNSFYMYLFSGVFLLVAFNEREKIISFLKSKTAVILLLFFAAILLPQVVLHARAGWVLRYLFPAFFAPAFAIALIFNQLQFHSKVYNYYGLLLLLYIGAEMLPKISDNPEQAFRSLRNYVSTCRHTENIIHSVISRSRKDDWLVIVSNPVQDYVWPMTLKSLFKTLHGKTNIARLIVTFPYEYDPVAQSRIASVAHYNEQFAQLDKNNIQDIVIMPYIERLFLHEHRSWFHPDEWERYQSWLFCHYHRKNHR
ncbi:MAG: hypothetical protein RMJ44_09110 [Cytophagales bacterium]|nr:hypothetical protein [Cytophagales bacterium]